MNSEIVFAASNKNIQELFDDTKLVDRWRFDEGNWFTPLFTSYSKNKSDRWMQRNITVRRLPDSCQYEFSLDAQHNFPSKDREQLQEWMSELGISDTESMLSVQ